MRLVILLSLATLASSASLDGDLCLKGESFWCQSLAVAEACGTVDHCMETTWKDTNLEEDESNVCLFCSAVVSDAREMSAAGKSENEVITFLSSASDLLPDVAKSLQSKKTIQTKSFMKILNSEIAPQMVCSLLDFCKGLPSEGDLRQVESSPEEIQEQPTESTSCTDCKKFFISLKSLITGPASALLTDIVIDEGCSRAGPYKTLCEELVKGYLTRTINITAGYLDPPRVCQAIKMCKKSHLRNEEETLEIDLSFINWEELLASFPTENLGLEQPTQTDERRQPSSCTDCTNFFTALKSILHDETPLFITDVIVDQVCSRLGKYQKQCQSIVNPYLTSLLQFAVNFLDPGQICRLARMCTKLQSPDELNSILWTKLIIPNATTGDSKTCEACKTAVQFIQSFLKSDTVKTYIEVLIEKLVCGRLGPVREMCEKLLKTELGMVLDLLARVMDASKVCPLIRLCQTSNVILVEDSLPVSEELEPLDTVECMMCETVIRLIRTAIDNNKTEEEVLKAMHGLCTYLPSQVAIAVCNNFVNNYGSKVIDAIRQELQPHDICVKLRLCTVLKFDLLDVAAVVGSEPCIICRSVVQYLETLVDQSDTVATIQGSLKTLCHSLSPVLEQQVCLPFVKKYIPLLIHELSVYMPPKFFCTKIRICTD